VEARVDWEIWWKSNLWRFVPVEARRQKVTGPGSVESQRKHIVEFLNVGLKHKYFCCRASSSLALGKMGISTSGSRVISLLRAPKLTTREMAAVSLGMMGYAEGIPVLTSLLKNARGEQSVRVCAALALGLSNVQVAGPDLVEVMEREGGKKGEDLEVRCAACLALGIMRFQDALQGLVRLARSPRADPILRSVAVSSIAKYRIPTVMAEEGEISVAPLFTNLLRSDPSRDVRRSAVLSLGAVWYRGLAQSLLQIHKTDDDGWVRCLSLIVMAENAKDPTEQKLVRGLFRRIIEETKDRSLRDCALLAAGISGDEKAIPLVRKIFAKEKYGPSWSASALAVGFLKDEESIPKLLQVLSSDPSTYKKAYACMSFALMEKGDEAVSKALRGILVGKINPYLRAMASLALARIGDRGAVPMLVDLLPKAKHPLFRKMTAMSLGFFRDFGAFAGLKAFFESKSTDNETRSGILVAVGCMGDDRKVPILRKASEHYNFLLPFMKIHEVLFQIM